MGKKEITITISGESATGKSRVSYIIKEILKVHGLEVQFDPKFEYLDEQTFNKSMRSNMDEALENIREKSMVVVKEVQTQKVPKKS